MSNIEGNVPADGAQTESDTTRVKPPILESMTEEEEEQVLQALLERRGLELKRSTANKKEKKKKTEGNNEPVGQGLVYVAPPASAVGNLVALLSLGLGFSSVAFAPLFLLWLGYLVSQGSMYAIAAVCVALSSLLWAKEASDAFRKSRLFATWRSFFALSVWKAAPLSADRNILFGVFPHGMFPMSLVLAAGVVEQIFPEWAPSSFARMTGAVASVFFRVPFLAPLLTLIGCHAADQHNVRRLVRRGSCFLLPDGIAGVFHSHPSKEVVYIKSRKGFVRLALQEGASLVPVYAFGHTQLHSVHPGPGGFFMQLSRKLRICILLYFRGLWGTPVPRPHPLHLAIGEPILLEQCENPTPDQVEQAHEKFMAALIALFEARKHQVPGYANKVLHIV